MNEKSTLRSLLNALDACATDLDVYPTDEGVSYLVARRLRNIKETLATLSARDLLTYVEAKP